MLSLSVNAAAEKLIRLELQRLGAPARFLASPGAGAATTEVAPPPIVPVGSVQQAALAHSISTAGAGDLQGRGPQRRRFAAEVAAPKVNETVVIGTETAATRVNAAEISSARREEA
ncbi:MAG: hypothetical protein WDM87_12620 [Terracidiphilus sp.]